jgi:hypothetical protein
LPITQKDGPIKINNDIFCQQIWGEPGDSVSSRFIPSNIERSRQLLLEELDLV